MDMKRTKKMEQPVVLVVEDEALIRMNALLMIEEAGYAAVEACNADEAIVILEGRSDICAVFTDVRMSGSMDGLNLAHAIRERWPPIHLIVTSGANNSSEWQLPANARFIRKPYKAEQLIATLQELFGHNSAPVNDNGYDRSKLA